MGTTEDPAPEGKSRRRGPYAKSEARRHQIVEAATEVFSVHGYRAGSLKDVAAIIGMNPTSIFHYFPTKSALLEAVLDARDAVSDAVAAGAGEEVSHDPRDIPLGLLRIARNNESAPGILSLYTLLAAESSIPGNPARDYFVERYRRVREQFRIGFATMAEHGLLAEGVTAEDAAASTLALWDGIQMQWMIEPGAVDVVDHLRRHLELITGLRIPAEKVAAL